MIYDEECVLLLNGNLNYNLASGALYGTVYKDLITDFKLPKSKYYSEEQLCSSLSKMKNYLSLLCLNCCRLEPKLNQISSLIDNFIRNNAYLSVLTL
jgi:hypothetical protein